LDWGQVAKRIRGDVVKFGWVKLVDYADSGMVPVLADEGRERLECYEGNEPPEQRNIDSMTFIILDCIQVRVARSQQ
jgi:hypothetical protein